jgi:hypothetical protein
MRSVSIEFVVGIVRWHPEGGSCVEHDPWDGVATIVVSGDCADIRGYKGAKPIADLRLLKEALRGLGIKRYTWDRYKKGHKVVEGST